MEDIKYVKRIFDILDLFVTHGSELGISQVAKQIGINKSTSSRIMATLETVDVLKKNPETQKYRLNVKILELAKVMLSSIDLKSLAKPYLKELNARTAELIQIHVLEGDRRLVLDWIDSTRPIRRVTDKVHMYGPLHAGAPGKLLLANLPDNKINEILERVGLPAYTAHTITNKNELVQGLDLIRKKGVVFSMGEHREFMYTVSAPIRNHLGEVIAALSISWLEMMNIPGLSDEYTALVQEYALKISHEMGFQVFGPSETIKVPMTQID
jgi:IclR family KDG regulon transcriptional repressor